MRLWRGEKSTGRCHKSEATVCDCFSRLKNQHIEAAILSQTTLGPSRSVLWMLTGSSLPRFQAEEGFSQPFLEILSGIELRNFCMQSRCSTIKLQPLLKKCGKYRNRLWNRYLNAGLLKKQSSFRQNNMYGIFCAHTNVVINKRNSTYRIWQPMLRQQEEFW